jgi:hypothetical protein
MKKITFLAAMLISFGINAQCLDWVNPTPETGWNDFNTMFGGAPMPDGDGNCEFNEITDFQVWASEAYAVDNFQEGVEYTFSMCNGSGAGNWVPEFTIIAPSGAVDSFGEGDGDGCSITWTASESGTYLIVINEAGECGGGSNLGTDNGFPALTCSSVLSTDDNIFEGFSYYYQEASGNLVLNASTTLENIQLYNILGQQTINKSLSSNTETVNLSGLKTGVYIAIVTIEGQTKTFKVSKK